MIKKITALLLTGMMILGMANVTYASEDVSEQIAQEIVESDMVDTLISDPDEVVDIILRVKELIDQQEISDSEIETGVNTALSEMGISINENEKAMLVKIAGKLIHMDIDETELRKKVNDIYGYMKEMGIGKEQVKGVLKKLIDLCRSFLG